MDPRYRRTHGPRSLRPMARVRVTLLSGKTAELYASPKMRVDELKTLAMAFDRKNDFVRLKSVWLKYKGQVLKEEMQHLYHLFPAELADEEFEFSIVLRSACTSAVKSLGVGYSRVQYPPPILGKIPSRHPELKRQDKPSSPTSTRDKAEVSKPESTKTRRLSRVISGSALLRAELPKSSSKAKRKWHITTVGLSAAEAMAKINLVSSDSTGISK